MSLTVLKTPPVASSFTPSNITPSTFSSPILFCQLENCNLIVPKSQLEFLPGFQTVAKEEEHDDGSDGRKEEKVRIEGVSVWISSLSLILYHSAANTGVDIPLTALTLHALQAGGSGIYIQLGLPAQSRTSAPAPTTSEKPESTEAKDAKPSATTNAEEDDEEDDEDYDNDDNVSEPEDILELTIHPIAPGPTAATGTEADTDTTPTANSLAQDAFEALSRGVAWLADDADSVDEGEGAGGIEWDWQDAEGEGGEWEDAVFEGEVEGEEESVPVGSVRRRGDDGREGEGKWRRTE